MKTIKQHLQEITDTDIREKALKNLESGCAEKEVDAIESAICGAFVWLYSPEGHEYWQYIMEGLTNQSTSSPTTI